MVPNGQCPRHAIAVYLSRTLLHAVCGVAWTFYPEGTVPDTVSWTSASLGANRVERVLYPSVYPDR